MMIITVLFIFIELHFKKYECPNVTVRKYFISNSVILCTLQLLHIRLPKSCGLINVHHKHNVGSARGFVIGRTKDYSEKPSSKVTTSCDQEIKWSWECIVIIYEACLFLHILYLKRI